MPKLPVKDSVSPSFARADAATYSFTDDRFAAATSDSAKLIALLTQFQARYPNASLVAELLTMHENQFVVRALVQIGGAALTSGMAAASDIEQAEDRAKLRALEMLTLQPIAPLESFPARPESVMHSGYDLQLRVTPPEPIAAHHEMISAEPPASLPSDFGSPLPVIEPVELIDRVVEPSPVAVEGIPDIPLPTWEPEPEPESEPEPEPERQPLPDPEPIDMSDAIARTSVELKRLGWTNVKGREHLEKTYGKRSRQQLTDTELLDFLRFLESQLSPGQSPF